MTLASALAALVAALNAYADALGSTQKEIAR